MSADNNIETQRQGPLRNLRVIDISTIIAGPVAAGMLADFGADVLKVELPGKGDGLRQLRPIKDNVSLWSKVINRNKKGITLDLRQPEGRVLFKRLIAQADVLVENFRPGTLERWGLSPETLWEITPNLTILRVSAYGQTGPYSERPGFARIADAMSGFLAISGQKDGPPSHPGYPIADSITGLFGVMGILMALLARKDDPDAPGQVVSVSLFESMFRVMDFSVIEYDQLGEVRQRNGNRNPYAAPGNCYLSKDGHWCSLAASTQSVFERLMTALGYPDLIKDPRFCSNMKRLENVEVLDDIINVWFAERDADDICGHLEAHDVSVAKVHTIADLFIDPHVLATDMIVPIQDPELGEVKMQSVTPRFSRTPGGVHRSGPSLGADNDETYQNQLGLSIEEIKRLKEKGVI